MSALATLEGGDGGPTTIPELDELDGRHVRELDLEKRASLTQELEGLNFEKVGALPLYASNGWIALRNYVKGY